MNEEGIVAKVKPATEHHSLSYMGDDVYQQLSTRYAHVLESARTFLNKKKGTKAGGTISRERKATLEKNHADCPQCGQVFRGGNHNTEHIHAKALGGEKSNKKNRIQICKVCNNSRNSTMQGFIGVPPYHRQREAQWPKIEAFLLWAELTIDDGIHAGAQIPEVHAHFLEARFAGEMPHAFYPKRAYGRFSTWSINDPPNYPHNRSTIRGVSSRGNIPKQRPTTTISSVLGRMGRAFFDRLFDYKPSVPQPLEHGLNDEHESVDSTLRHANENIEAIATSSNTQPPVEIEVDELRKKWKEVLDLEFSNQNGVIALGIFWNMIVESRTNSGLPWRAFEKAFNVRHKGAMPMKASEFLEQMGYSFVFVKQENGYMIHLCGEEE
jgi:5-methylcytosine-specific restriction endonuclease McrA